MERVMDKEKLENKYRDLADEQLVEIATSSSGDYTDEAIGAARAELDGRRIPIEPSPRPSTSSTRTMSWKPLLGAAVLIGATAILLLPRISEEEPARSPPGLVEPVCDTIDFAGCQKACTEGKARGCISLGTMQQSGISTTKSIRKAADSFRRACDLGEARGCFYAGIALGAAHEGQPPIDPKAAIHLLDKGCAERAWGACSQLGVHHETGTGTDKDVAKARSLYEQACNRKDGHGCTRLGYLHEDGTAVDKDAVAAVRLYEKACDLNDQDGCFVLAVMLGEGRGTDQDTGRAKQIFADLCRTHGYVEACKEAKIEDPFANGKTEMRAIFDEQEKQCIAGDLYACSALGAAYSTGFGVEQDFNRALKFQTKACDGDMPRACYMLGHMYEDGAGFGLDPKAAPPIFEKACRLGEELSCRWLKAPW
jgi:TPR repeat protein